MNLQDIPKPLVYGLTMLVLLILGYGSVKQFSNLQIISPDAPKPTTQNLIDVKLHLFDAFTRSPVKNAKVRIESNNGPADTLLTNSEGDVLLRIPSTNSVPITVLKEGCENYSTDINLLTNPDRYKQIPFTCSKPQKKSQPNN